MPVNDVLIVYMQTDMVEAWYLLREHLLPVSLHLPQMALTVDDLVKADPVIPEQGADVRFRAE